MWERQAVAASVRANDPDSTVKLKTGESYALRPAADSALMRLGRVRVDMSQGVCCAVLCCAVLCYAMLCCAVLCCAVLCCAVLCCAVLCCAVLMFLCVHVRTCGRCVCVPCISHAPPCWQAVSKNRKSMTLLSHPCVCMRARVCVRACVFVCVCVHSAAGGTWAVPTGHKPDRALPLMNTLAEEGEVPTYNDAHYNRVRGLNVESGAGALAVAAAAEAAKAAGGMRKPIVLASDAVVPAVARGGEARAGATGAGAREGSVAGASGRATVASRGVLAGPGGSKGAFV
jgi:hypothetical protein